MKCQRLRKRRRRGAARLRVSQSRATGFTLLEVLLSVALFMGAVTVLSQLWYSGVRAAVQARLQTQAVLRCESKMNEVVAGVIPLQPVTDTPFEDDTSWTWSLQVLPESTPNVWRLVVTVLHPGQGGLSAAGHQLTRLLRDPQVWVDAQESSTGTTSGTGTTP